jgi:putative N6-adenine-specific DNA methylase
LHKTTPVQKPIKMLAKTLAGLEAVLVEELKSIGANEIVKANRAVAFEGDLKTLYQSIFYAAPHYEY